MDLSWNCVRARGLGGLFKCLLKTGSRRKFDCVQITMPVFLWSLVGSYITQSAADNTNLHNPPKFSFLYS